MQLARMDSPTSSAKRFIDQTRSSAPVAMFSKSYCPLCKRVKVLLAQYTSEMYVVELDQRDDMAACQDVLLHMTDRHSVPQVSATKPPFASRERASANSSQTGVQGVKKSQPLARGWPFWLTCLILFSLGVCWRCHDWRLLRCLHSA
mmetsp:Transcript_55588/g.121049  ORF Transcript_55588/g.121049 Transcript_55588/m.121049 type:complete len:147 (-) Transcript_55588:930-1370(-)